MARRPAQKPTRKTAPKGATSRRAPRQQGQMSIPGWLWGLVGLIAGFALSQYLQESAPPMATVVPKPPTSTSAPASQPTENASESSTEPRMPTFEFYTLLPESEVIAPKPEEVQSTPSTAAVADVVENDSAVEAAAQPSEGRDSFMLQAASFQDANDAQRLADRLGNLGLQAQITTVKATGNQTWHRVQVGPYRDTRELSRAQDLMVTQGIEPLTIKLQD